MNVLYLTPESGNQTVKLYSRSNQLEAFCIASQQMRDHEFALPGGFGGDYRLRLFADS